VISNLKSRLKQLGKVGTTFLVLLPIYLILLSLAPSSGFTTFLQLVLAVLGAWLVIRFGRIGMRKAIWRLRNRILVTYLFIAVVPVLLILTLVALGGDILASQIAVYIATSELDHNIAVLQSVTGKLARTPPGELRAVMGTLGDAYRERFPGLSIFIQEPSSVGRWPENADGNPPDANWPDASGVVIREGRHYAWSRAMRDGVACTAAAPLTRRFLSEMAPGLGEVSLFRWSTAGGSQSAATSQQVEGYKQPPLVNRTPPPGSWWDADISGIAETPVADWANAGQMHKDWILAVHTHILAIPDIIASRKADELQGVLAIFLFILAILFLIVEMISLVIGISLTRTITGAVHSLYGGTQRVMEGDFSGRIQVRGSDQLAELGRSFNSMTENLERLLAVAKEKERLQAEIEIAQQVQEQLYPKKTPVLKTLRVMGLCQPARMVSGDYYDFQRLQDDRLAIAIGDVAGKGISAALLMASIQSALRMELRNSLELAAAAPHGMNGSRLSTARAVFDLNQQLFATTSPEKYATFYFAIYDEQTGALRYTNAGHLPPILFRGSAATRLDVNGTVVGAFPSSRYEESCIHLEKGDLLVCYTDGITEPENEYGEMFGEERLIELVSKNIDLDEDAITKSIIDAVRQWTGSPELQDDMTLLLARKL